MTEATDQHAIRLTAVSKEYRIGASQGEGMLRDALVGGAKRLLGRGPAKAEPKTVWALKDVSLEVAKDEVVGVIGRNGSGKTTLLKLLSKITYPTSGEIDVRGRVASLVEVGTGFHNELSGRDNIYLNGSILGLKRREIAEHFDAIVEYSGVGSFLDTPIKRYSTGMRLRLGFAVAAHLFPDVLLVDEVLAVGDAEFQAKCLATLSEVGRRGHAVLFVSHNLEAIESICSRTIWIDRGVLRMDGPSREVIAAYLKETAQANTAVIDLSQSEGRPGTGEARFRSMEFLAADGSPLEVIRTADEVTVRFHFEAHEEIQSPYVGLSMFTEFGTLVTHPNTWSAGLELGRVAPGQHTLDLHIRRVPLMPGRYPLTLWMNRHSDSESIDWLEQCATLTVHSPGKTVFERSLPRRTGAVLLDAEWRSAPS
ncbi:Teichoic acids export ATP-binding protein TagH [Planctomycetes bacterium Poly30]|uniref:Teichoic acids export ATP-binding protein TagH n=1 Tax=Saltatorellus ferox TaxID=2528018 RepID=A0A518F1A5_9BACT|nr:Teichoic acids export ATP-binding protein TagH [Planctomycetes bacterium Poly30]